MKRVSILREALSRSNFSPNVVERYNKIIKDLEEEWGVTLLMKQRASDEIKELIDKFITKDKIPPRVVLNILSEAIEEEITFIEETDGWISECLKSE